MSSVESKQTRTGSPSEQAYVPAARGRVPVKEVWFCRPLVGLVQGSNYIGKGPAWSSFKVFADLDLRLVVVSTPDRRVIRVPFESVTMFITDTG